MSKVCLVLEGGATRGSYTAGVLDAFLENDIHIGDIYGVSAGTLNAICYLSNQPGRSIEILKNHLMNNKCIDYKRILTLNVINLDYLFSKVDEMLDIEAFNEHKNHFYAVSTNVETGRPFYKEIVDYELDKDYMKASAALPMFAKMIKKDGVKLVDGGVSDSIPVIRALEDGYDKVIVILTRHEQFKRKPYKLIKLYKAIYSGYPLLIHSLENRHNEYNTVKDAIACLEKEGRVLPIYPSKEIKLSLAEKDTEKIDSVYELGKQDGWNVINRVKEFVGGMDNEKNSRTKR